MGHVLVPGAGLGYGTHCQECRRLSRDVEKRLRQRQRRFNFAVYHRGLPLPSSNINMNNMLMVTTLKITFYGTKCGLTFQVAIDRRRSEVGKQMTSIRH